MAVMNAGGVKPDDLINHVIKDEYVVKPVCATELDEEYAGQQFDFGQLQLDFMEFCYDYGLKAVDSTTKFYQFFFAGKVLFTCGPESRSVKQGGNDNTWKFAFKYKKTVRAVLDAIADKTRKARATLNDSKRLLADLRGKSEGGKKGGNEIAAREAEIMEIVGLIKSYENEAWQVRMQSSNVEDDQDVEIKYVYVSTYKSNKYAYRAADNIMEISVKQASLLSMISLSLASDVLAHDKIILTPLAGAIFARDEVKEIAEFWKISANKSASILNASCQSGGHYLPRSDANVAIAASLCATRNAKQELKEAIVTKTAKQYFKAGKQFNELDFNFFCTQATAGLPSNMKFSVLEDLFKKAQLFTPIGKSGIKTMDDFKKLSFKQRAEVKALGEIRTR
uniref:Putative nucleoprotein n=1 Tax=Hubei bunya-like virus 8 TaxID=1922853 RepID=A0A1L3KPI2_9VIRU|nr:putative nucleoprotein [Hubei bunya-like virus 8]